LVENARRRPALPASGLAAAEETREVKTKMFNNAFVLMEYFGYLRRAPARPVLKQ
jgi:hypothetical protein